MPKSLLIILIAASLATFVGCNAPHDNPLDPASDSYIKPWNLTARIRSVHVDRVTTDIYYVLAELDGPDAAWLDSAWVWYDTRDPVRLDSVAPALWSSVLTGSYLGDATLRSVRLPFYFRAQDASGARHECAPAYLWRVIESSPLLQSPVGGEIVGARPVLEWQAFSATFTFGFQAAITNITDPFNPDEVWRSQRYSSDVRSVVVGDSLADGRYTWSISVLDQWDNVSRSLDGYFIVDNSRNGGITRRPIAAHD